MPVAVTVSSVGPRHGGDGDGPGTGGGPGRWIAAYDISDDRCRDKLSDQLERHGVRVQFSVFEIVAPPVVVRSLFDRARSELLGSSDSLLLQPVCASCRRRRLITGPMDFVPDEPWWVV